MEKQPTGRTSGLPAWHEWEVPPLWVFVVGGLVLIGFATIIFIKVGESFTASRVPATPTVSASPSGRPLD